MNSQQLILFVPAALLVTLAPGPDNLGVLALSLSNGRRASLGFALGCAAGCLNHTALAALGLTALLASSPLALHALKLLGASYLAWIGWQSLRGLKSTAHIDTGPQAAAPDSNFLPHFKRGLIANAINPKVALFFLAFLPQFIVQNSHWSSPAQTACLGLIFTAIAALCFSLIALMASQLGQLLRSRPIYHTGLQGLSGLLFIALALKLALSDLAPPESGPG